MTTNTPTNQIQLTQKGYDELVVELDELKTKRQVAVDRVATARSYGDLSENAEYHAAKEDLSLIDSRIEEIEGVISQAKVIKHSKNSTTVKVGSTVTVKHKGKKVQYQIVTAWEADPMENKISSDSPIGQSFLGKKQGNTITVAVPAGEQKYEIVKIE